MLSAASGAIMSAFLVIEQVAKPLVWVLLGLAGGVATDRSRWMSKGFLSLLSSIAWAATLSRPGILSPLLCSVAVVIGSRLRVVGLTGGIASGKSAAVQRLRALKIPVVDADAISHQILQKGTPAHSRVVKAFKKFPGVVEKGGDINRAALRSLVFGDRNLNHVLKQCTHQAIAYEMVRQLLVLSLVRRAPLVVLDAPLLFESKADMFCKTTICVHCSEATQVKRLGARDKVSLEECRKAISAQMPVADKVRRATVAIENDSSLGELHTQVDEAVARLREEASAHPFAPLLARL